MKSSIQKIKDLLMADSNKVYKDKIFLCTITGVSTILNGTDESAILALV